MKSGCEQTTCGNHKSFALDVDDKMLGLQRDGETMFIACISKGTVTAALGAEVEFAGIGETDGEWHRLGWMTTVAKDGMSDEYELVELRMQTTVENAADVGFFTAMHSGSGVFKFDAQEDSVLPPPVATYEEFVNKYMLSSTGNKQYFEPGRSMFVELDNLQTTRAVRMTCFYGMHDPRDPHKKTACGVDWLVRVKE